MAFSENISLLVYRLGWRTTRTLPASAAYRLFDRVADGMYRRGGHGVDSAWQRHVGFATGLHPRRVLGRIQGCDSLAASFS